MIELKPCPFCGSEADIRKKAKGDFGYEYRFKIKCESCGCSTPWLCYLDDAAEVWNRRAEKE